MEQSAEISRFHVKVFERSAPNKTFETFIGPLGNWTVGFVIMINDLKELLLCTARRGLRVTLAGFQGFLRENCLKRNSAARNELL